MFNSAPFAPTQSAPQRRRVARHFVTGVALVTLLNGCAMFGKGGDAPLDRDALLSAPDVSIQEILNHSEFMSSTRQINQACIAGISTTPKRLSETITAAPPSWPDWAALPMLDTFFRRYVFVQSVQNADQVYLMRDTKDYPAPECHGPFERSKVARFLNTPSAETK